MLPFLIVSIVPFLGAMICLVKAHDDKEVSLREQTTTGTITAHEPQNHNGYGYKFQVDGSSYNGWETPLKTEPKLGQSVTVYYDPLNPARNALTDFSERSAREQGTSIGLLFFGAVFIATAYSIDFVVRKYRIRRLRARE